MKLIAARQLYGSYGRVGPGEEFECPADTARELLSRGLARHALPPKVLYEVRGGRFVTPADEGLKERD